MVEVAPTTAMAASARTFMTEWYASNSDWTPPTMDRRRGVTHAAVSLYPELLVLLARSRGERAEHRDDHPPAKPPRENPCKHRGFLSFIPRRTRSEDATREP